MAAMTFAANERVFQWVPAGLDTVIPSTATLNG